MAHRLAGIAVVLVVALLALEAGGGARRPALTAHQALAQVSDERFVNVRLAPQPASFRCDTGAILIGTPRPRERFPGYHRSRYLLLFDDRRFRPDGHVAMFVAAFADRGFAARCARRGLRAARHRPADSLDPEGSASPYRMIDATTVESHMHPPSSRPGVIPGSTGVFETFLARGPVLAYGVAWNGRESAIVRRDLALAMAQVAGAA
jgi:hypothetical protein